jgi:hypothetical protein
VIANVPYDISVAAVDESGHAHTPSAVFRFTWTPPVVLATVPWPARPLPPVKPFDDLAAPVFDGSIFRASAVMPLNGNNEFDRRYPVGIVIGDFSRVFLDADSNRVFDNAGQTNFASYSLQAASSLDPNQLFGLRRISDNPARRGETLLPIVVYRQQVTNALFPRVSGTVIQVTPLVERIPWVRTGSFGAYIPDRLITMGHTWLNDSYIPLFCLSDQQPVILGAKYRYFLVRFNSNREPQEIISAGVIEIPTTL